MTISIGTLYAHVPRQTGRQASRQDLGRSRASSAQAAGAAGPLNLKPGMSLQGSDSGSDGEDPADFLRSRRRGASPTAEPEPEPELEAAPWPTPLAALAPKPVGLGGERAVGGAAEGPRQPC